VHSTHNAVNVYRVKSRERCRDATRELSSKPLEG
jgi:hypothetical protein